MQVDTGYTKIFEPAIRTEQADDQPGVAGFGVGKIAPGISETFGIAGVMLDPARAETVEVAQHHFQTVMVSLMLKDAMQDDFQSMFGKGVAGDMYLSVFTDLIASKIVENGTFGKANPFGIVKDD